MSQKGVTGFKLPPEIGPPLPPASRCAGAIPLLLFGMLLPGTRPEATFDLHGQTTLEAEQNAEAFLRSQRRTGRRVVRLITGRGKGGGAAPVRTRVRTLLRRLAGEVVREFELEETEGSFLVELLP